MIIKRQRDWQIAFSIEGKEGEIVQSSVTHGCKEFIIENFRTSPESTNTRIKAIAVDEKITYVDKPSSDFYERNEAAIHALDLPASKHTVTIHVKFLHDGKWFAAMFGKVPA